VRACLAGVLFVLVTQAALPVALAQQVVYCRLVQLLRNADGARKEVAGASRAARAALAGLRQRAEQRRGRPPPE
jgi:hypothetical protein